MRGCIFCQIIKGEITSQKIYENEWGMAFLDIQPLVPGHTLVIPKEHGETILDISDKAVVELNLIIKKVTAAIDQALKPDGFTIGLNHKIGQAVPHLHVHILPRWLGDGGGNIHSIVHNKPKEDLEEIRDKIRSHIK